MATHSLTGAKSSTSRDKVVKPAMNQSEVQEIIGDNLIALIFTWQVFSLKWLLNLGVVVHPCHLDTWEVGVGGPGIWHHSVCIAESGDSRGCMSPYLKKKRRNHCQTKSKLSITEKFKLIKFKASESFSFTILKFQEKFVFLSKYKLVISLVYCSFLERDHFNHIAFKLVNHLKKQCSTLSRFWFGLVLQASKKFRTSLTKLLMDHFLVNKWSTYFD